MKTLEFIYQDAPIHFTIENNNMVRVNATEMARIFNKDVRDFVVLKATKDFIKAYLESKNAGIDTDNARYLKKEDVLLSKPKQDTYMDGLLAFKFAGWLDPCFEVWIHKTIENLKFSPNNAPLISLNAQLEEQIYYNELCTTAIQSQNELALLIIDSHKILERFKADKANTLRKQKKEVALNLFNELH